jgi:hypothetical protein
MATLKKSTLLLFSLLLLLSTVSPAAMVGARQNANAHPLLMQMAEASPQQRVTVIVQKTDRTQNAEARAEALGGVIGKDLSIIHAFTAEMAAGAAALVLQDEPNLTPDQVKYRLMNATSRKFSQKVGRITYSIPYVDVYATVTGSSTQSANTGITASQLLWTGSTPVTWISVALNSVAGNSVAWNSVYWGS